MGLRLILRTFFTLKNYLDFTLSSLYVAFIEYRSHKVCSFSILITLSIHKIILNDDVDYEQKISTTKLIIK